MQIDLQISKVWRTALRRNLSRHDLPSEGGTPNKKSTNADTVADRFADGESRKGHYEKE